MQPPWKTVWGFLKKLKKNYHIIHQFHFWIYIQRKWKHWFKQYTHPNVLSSIIFFSFFFFGVFLFLLLLLFLLYNIVLVLPYMQRASPRVYMCGWGTCEIPLFSSWFCLMLIQWLQLSLGSCLYSIAFSSFHFQPVYFLD